MKIVLAALSMLLFCTAANAMPFDPATAKNTFKVQPASAKTQQESLKNELQAKNADAMPFDPSEAKTSFKVKGGKNDKLHEKAQELESVLVQTMIEPMFPKGDESGLYGGGQGNGIFRTMMIQQYAETLTKSNGLGLTANIEKELKNK